jgi:hypothetical protein
MTSAVKHFEWRPRGKRRPRHRPRLGGEAVTARRRPRALLALSMVLLAAAAGGCGDLSRDELNRGAESLSALAAQGQLIANGVARDATKSTYVRVMAGTLGDEAEHEAEKLADAEPSPEVGRQRDAAVQVALEIADLYEQLAVFPGDERHGEAVEAHMEQAQEDADAIVEELTGEPQ